MKVISNKPLKYWETNKPLIKSLLPLLFVISFLSLWVSLCYNYNLFLHEALVSSSIILSIAMLHSIQSDKHLDQNC